MNAEQRRGFPTRRVWRRSWCGSTSTRVSGGGSPWRRRLQEKSGDVNVAKVFVSYAREDKDFARQLAFALEDKGFGPLMDVRAIVPGENWQLRLLNLIDQSTSIVVVLTDAYLNSEACGWEVNEAEQRGKRMLCVLPQRLTDGGKVPNVLARDLHIGILRKLRGSQFPLSDSERKLEMGFARTSTGSHSTPLRAAAAEWQAENRKADF